VLEWPFQEWPDTPIEALRTLDPDLGLPFALADAAIDLQPLPGQPLRSLLVAAPRALVEAWVAVLQLAGMPLERLLPQQVCLREALLPHFGGAGGVVLLQPGALAHTLQLWQQGVPLYERLLPADDPQLADHIEEVIAFYRSQDAAYVPRQLWLTGPLPGQETLAQALHLPLEPFTWAPYDAPVLQGLALVR
jgi:Tfp pilus assembly PilM family ATPase